MFLYILKRLLLLIPTLVGITFVTFMVMKLAPGDPVMIKLMFAGQGISPEALAAQLQSEKPAIELPEGYVLFSRNLSKKIHGIEDAKPDLIGPYNESIILDSNVYKSFKWVGENAVFYLKWVKNIAMLDFGISSKDKRSITDKIKEALPITLLINILTILIVYTVSIPLGIWSALRQGSTLDKIVMVKMFIFYSLPTFWVASMLLMYFAGGEYYNWFPIMGYQSDVEGLSFFQRVVDVAWHLVLPIIATTIGSFAFLARFSRSNFLDVVKQDYMRTARAKGLSETKVLYKHGLRNALIPFVTLMGTLLPGLLGGSVIIEQIFSIPGMGMLSFEAVLGRDHNLIMGVATIGAFLTLISLLLADLLYGFVDPRIRLD
jgi:peptide/nickel transport system permease protein